MCAYFQNYNFNTEKNINFKNEKKLKYILKNFSKENYKENGK